MNYQTRRDRAWSRAYQQWVEALAVLAAQELPFDSVTEETWTDEIQAEYDALSLTFGRAVRDAERELGQDGGLMARDTARKLARLAA